MREVTKRMISNFKIHNLGYDFMGYDVNCQESLSFHHLIVPHKNFADVGKGGYEEWNGAILVRDTSHDYLHLIEKYDFNIFIDITSEMIDQNVKGKLDPYNIRLIDMLLKDFEQEWEGEIGYNGKPLIKDEFRKRLNRVR
jgi:hypothetical protein